MSLPGPIISAEDLDETPSRASKRYVTGKITSVKVDNVLPRRMYSRVNIADETPVILQQENNKLNQIQGMLNQLERFDSSIDKLKP